MKRINQFILLFCFLMATITYSQTSMLIHMSDGSTESIPISDILKITFKLGSIPINKKITMKKIQNLTANIVISNGIATLKFNMSEAKKVKVNVFNMAGQMVKKLDKGSLNAGSHKLFLKTNDLAKGNYILNLKVGTKRIYKKLLIVK